MNNEKYDMQKHDSIIFNYDLSCIYSALENKSYDYIKDILKFKEKNAQKILKVLKNIDWQEVEKNIGELADEVIAPA